MTTDIGGRQIGVTVSVLLASTYHFNVQCRECTYDIDDMIRVLYLVFVQVPCPIVRYSTGMLVLVPRQPLLQLLRAQIPLMRVPLSYLSDMGHMRTAHM